MTEKHPRRINSRVLIIALLAIIGILVIIILALNRIPDVDNSGNEKPMAEVHSIEISTPVGKLTFPQEYSDSVRIEDTSSGDQFAMSFYGTAGKSEVLLFEISIGANGTGYQLGSIPDTDGNPQMIWLNISEIKADPSWSEEETAQINLMQECVNDLIEQFHDMEGFQEGK